MSISIAPVSTGRGIKPQIGWLTVNRACNMRCGWCYAKGTEYKKEDDMSLEMARRLLNMMKPLGVRSITLIGGEPTLWDHLSEFNRLCREQGVETTLVTNGTRLGMDQYWHEYQQSPCTRIGLSIKAFNEESFICTTGTSGFELTRRGIARALSSKSCSANIVYTGEDPDELVKIARFAAECGARSLGISPSTPAYVNGKPDILHVSNPERFVDNIVRHYHELNGLYEGRINIAAKLPLCIWPKEFILTLIDRSQIITTCQLQHRSGLLFDADGKMISCNSLHDFPIGQLDQDFSDSASLKAHIASDQVVGFYDQVATYASSRCQTCSMKKFCGGGCPLFYGAYDGAKLVIGWDETPAH